MVAITVAIAASLYFYINGFMPSMDRLPEFFFANPTPTDEKIHVIIGDETNWEDLAIVYEGKRIPTGKTGSVCGGDIFDVGKAMDGAGVEMAAGETYKIAIVYETRMLIGEYTFKNKEANHAAIGNQPPQFTGKWEPVQIKNAGVPIPTPQPILLKIEVTDPNNDPMVVTFYGGLAGDLKLIGAVTDVQSGEFASIPWPGLEELKTYFWYAIANDGISSTQSITYEFLTEVDMNNHPPSFGPPTPADGAIKQPVAFTWSITISDVDQFSWSIQCSNGQIQSSNTPEGTGIKSIALKNLLAIGTYSVTVTATDSFGRITTQTYSFIR